MMTFRFRLHIDFPLLGLLLLLTAFGLLILYSASSENIWLLKKQGMHFLLGAGILCVLAQITPEQYYHWTPRFFILCVGLLLLTLIMGHIGKGAQRWLNLGVIRVQPGEFMKLAVPMMTSWYLARRPLPPNITTLAMAAAIILIPSLLVMKQPDLGTAILIAMSGFIVLFLAGLPWRVLFTALASLAAAAPFLWHFMHDYQRQRVLTFLNPESDPLGSGYHIIQSKIAIGSGGVFGKGLLHGSQAHLNFLPEHATDFIFAVCGEELGLLGASLLILCFVAVTARAIVVSFHGGDRYSRLLAGGLGFAFFMSGFINMGMVTGILPVVGIPLPMVSYGGSSLLTLFAGFGILMSIAQHKPLLAR